MLIRCLMHRRHQNEICLAARRLGGPGVRVGVRDDVRDDVREDVRGGHRPA